MMYRIRLHQSGGNFTITKESQASRPITCYKDDLQMESNTAYAVVTDEPNDESLLIRLLDMSAPKNMRGLFLRIVLKNQKLEEDFGVKVINNFRIGTNLFDTMVGTGAAHEKMCSTIFDKIWTRGIVKFSKIIRELQVLYCKDQKRTKHLPWLDGISLNESKILEELLAHKVGK